MEGRAAAAVRVAERVGPAACCGAPCTGRARGGRGNGETSSCRRGGVLLGERGRSLRGGGLGQGRGAGQPDREHHHPQRNSSHAPHPASSLHEYTTLPGCRLTERAVQGRLVLPRAGAGKSADSSFGAVTVCPSFGRTLLLPGSVPARPLLGRGCTDRRELERCGVPFARRPRGVRALGGRCIVRRPPCARGRVRRSTPFPGSSLRASLRRVAPLRPCWEVSEGVAPAPWALEGEPPAPAACRGGL
jgi:hypothetical protein